MENEIKQFEENSGDEEENEGREDEGTVKYTLPEKLISLREIQSLLKRR